jgi:uncharacterized protein (TIGR00299 family) protein
MKILYFDCFSGISGDMTIGALLDLGLPFDYLEKHLRKLSLEGYQIKSEITERHKISAIKFDIVTMDDKTHRHLKEILNIINASELTDRIKSISTRAFGRLAEAEAKIHNTTPEKVHFHEVGGIDAIIDIVGSAIGIEYFRPDVIYSSPLTLGRGTTRSSHGVIPIPAPATVEILKDVPIRITETEGEKVTPTGAAILKSLLEFYNGSFAVPEFLTNKTGYGAGTRVFDDCPNLLRIILGNTADDYKNVDEIEIIETNIDDMNPQVYDHLFAMLYKAGALEVYLTPVLMKKNRPGHVLTVLCKKDLAAVVCDIIFSETSTAGIRFRSDFRKILNRREKSVRTSFGPIRVKILELKNGYKVQPEYNDCQRAASQYNIPLKDVMETVKRQAEIEEGKADEH